MTGKLMTVAAFTVLGLSVAATAATPFLRANAVRTADAADPQTAPLIVKVGAAEKQLSGYRDPHARRSKVASQTVNSCWVQTRYGTVNICETDGRGD